MDDDRPPEREPDEDCNARRFDGDRFLGYCNRVAGWGTDHLHEGRCSSHGGGGGAPEKNQNAVGNDGGDGAPEGNNYAEKHAIHSDRLKYYDRLSDTDRALVDDIAESLLNRASYPATDKDVAVACLLAAIDEHKRFVANEYIAEEGLITENVVGYDDEGDPIVKKEENPANLPYSRLSGDVLRVKKEYGTLDDPDSQQAEATESFADAVADLAAEQDGDGS